MGFPCNQFGEQEPDPESTIKQFVQEKYGVTFPMFSKVDVNGPNTHPVYQFLKTTESFIERGEIERKGKIVQAGQIAWNFEKFLVDREGKTFSWYKHKPLDIENIVEDIVALLDKQ